VAEACALSQSGTAESATGVAAESVPAGSVGQHARGAAAVRGPL